MTYRCDVRMTWQLASGSPGFNTWFFRATDTGAPTSDEDLTVATSALATFYQEIRSIYPTGVTIDFDGAWTGANTTDAGKTFVADPWSVAGNGGSSFLPPANAVLLRRGSATGGRRGKGHAYLGPVAETVLNADGRVIPAKRDLVTAAAMQLLMPGGNNGAFGTQSRAENVFRDYTDFSVTSDFAVLRSRRD